MNIDLPSQSPPPPRETLSSGQCLLIDTVFLAIALTAIPLALSYHSWSVGGLTAGLVLLGVFLAMALLGAGFLAILLRHSSLPPASVFPHAARLGARGGALLVLLGGGIFVLIASLRQREWLSDSAVSANPYALWLAVPLSLIPVVSGTSVFSIFFSFLLRGQVPAEPSLVTPPESAGSRGGGLYVTAMILATLALLAPSVLPFIPEKPPSIVVVPVEPIGVQAMAVDQPAEPIVPEPVYYYSPPLRFDTAAPHQWEILTRKVIEGVDGSRPVMMSPDGQYLAYVPANGSAMLVVFDLNRFEFHSSYEPMDRLRELAWSPESDQIFCLTGQERPFTSVIRLSQKKRFPLPLYQSAAFPEGQPFWWQEFEVAFVPDSGTRIFLDLIEMRVRPLEESHRWREKVEEAPPGEQNTPRLELSTTARSRLTVAPRITSYEAPDFQQSEWELIWEPVFAVADKEFPQLGCLPLGGIQEGDRIASSARSTKIVRLGDDRAEVTYFTLKEKPAPFLEVVLPDGTNFDAKDGFREKLEAYEVCGFVCAPRLNPLTGQVIGPDREKVKALVRWMGWDETKATLWIAEQYEAIAAGDVVSDLHVWDGAKPVSLSTPFPDRWWAAVSYPPDPAKLPSPAPGMTPLDRGSRASFRIDQGTLQFFELVYPVAVAAPPKVEPPSTPGPVDPEAAPSKPAVPPVTVEEKIRAFVREHYRKLSAKDFEGYLDDYSENMVYYGKAGTKNESLSRAILSLRSAKSLTAVPSEQIEVREEVLDGVKTYAVSYDMTLTKEDSSGSRKSHRSRVLLSVFLLRESIRIVNEGGPEEGASPP